jgi:hypothetical protein
VTCSTTSRKLVKPGLEDGFRLLCCRLVRSFALIIVYTD